MRASTRTSLVACLLVVCLAAPAMAQDITQDPGADARMHFGPLALTPRLGLRDVGVDSNVLNSSGDPQKDFTATFLTGADAWLTAGRTRLTSKTEVGWVYYQDLVGQRSFDFAEKARYDVFLNRVVPYVIGEYDRTRQRLNYEIDARALRTSGTAGGGVILRAGARLSFDVGAVRRRLSFADDQTIEGVRLAAALNRTEDLLNTTVRVSLTPLTTFVVLMGGEHDRFEFSSFRDSNSVRVEPGFELKPYALISGRALVGYRHFDALTPGVPDFSGVVAAVDVSYTMREMTRLAVVFNRDVDYSYEVTSPYYISTGGTLTLTQAVGTSWDVLARIGRTRLAYQGLSSLGVPISDQSTRTDRVFLYGIGVGRRIAEDVRVGVNAEWLRRSSPIQVRTYTGVKIGGSVTYGF
jgi:hypothetical protein